MALLTRTHLLADQYSTARFPSPLFPIIRGRVSAGVVETAEVEAEAEAVSLEVGETDAGAGSYRLSWTQPDHGDAVIL